MRIDNAGRVGIGAVPTVSTRLYVGGNTTGNSNQFGFYSDGQFQSDVTGNANYFTTSARTATASFTVSALSHYVATQGTFGVGSTIANQYGFNVSSTLTGATNNYGFYGNIASGTGRYNFYAAGTADNYFAGNVGLGTTTPLYKLDVNAGTANDVASFESTDPTANLYLKDSVSSSSFSTQSGGLVINADIFNAAASSFISLLVDGTNRFNIASTGTISLGAAPGSESLRVTPVASAVNYAEIQGAVTTASPSITAAGSDTNIDLALTPKGTGKVTTNGGLQISKTAVTAPAASDGNVFSGTYTPTLTNVANVTSSTAYVLQYMRVGNVVTVSGVVDIVATLAALTDTSIRLSLPIASAFTSSTQGTGTGVHTSTTTARNSFASLNSVAATDDMLLRFASNFAGTTSYFFTFTYQVI
jgi:hypothetical protein